MFTTQVDFENAGDLKVFVDEEQLQALESRMAEKGYLEGKSMASTFNFLRSNDLIWSYVVNNYLLGKEPFPFDLLYWNSDSTRMPAAMHSFYLRECYLNNTLSRGEMTLKRRQDQSEEVENTGLQPGRPGRSHRTPALDIPRRKVSRRQDTAGGGRFGPCRRCGQPAVHGQVSVLAQ